MAHESQPLDDTTSDDDSLLSSDAGLVHDISPQLNSQSRIHHLEPRSWQDFLELEPPPIGQYDLVDGIVIWRPPMASKEHDNLITAYIFILTYLMCDAYSYSTPSIQVLDDDGNLLWTRHISNGSSVSATSSCEQYGLRHPDIIVARRTSDSSINSDRSVNDEGSAGQIQFAHPYRRRIKMIVEITSHSNRDEDLYVKWATYARSGVDLYVILDRGMEGTRNFRVIVGSAKNIRGYELSYHGDPDLSPHAKPHRTLKLSRSGAASPVTRTPGYYRKVFEQNEIVSCEYFSELKLSPMQLLNDKYMTKLSKAILNEQDKQKLQAEQSRREAKEAKHEARKAHDRAEKAETSIAVLEKQHQDAQKEILRLRALVESTKSDGKYTNKKDRRHVDGSSMRLSPPRTSPPQTPFRGQSSKVARSSRPRSPQKAFQGNSSAGSMSPKKKSQRKH